MHPIGPFESIRRAGGKLEPRVDRMSLVSRTASFGAAMREKRDRLKPRSRNLHGDYKRLVATLEQEFDGMGPKASTDSDNL